VHFWPTNDLNSHFRKRYGLFRRSWIQRPGPQTKDLNLEVWQRYALEAADLCFQSHQEGVLAPLLVRELEESKYEVAAGARRLRAARIAELENLPVRIVKLTDAEAIEAQCVELSVVGKISLC
jgi:hypothetical protein